MARLPALRDRFRPLPAALIAVAGLVVLSALFARPPVRDAVTLGAVSEVSLQRPGSYLLIAPVSNVLDTLTILSVRQHIALVVTILACYVAWWWLAGRAALVGMTPARRALREVARIGVGLVVLLALYAAMAIMPRPMARLEAPTDVMVIDFHAHTRFSHDGRSDWGPEDVRRWHRDAGFDVAYITDHRTFEGARAGWANNPALAGNGTVLLPGIEVVWRGEHVNILDADRMYRGLLDAPLRDIDEQALVMASSLAGNEPVLVETIPGKLSNVVAAAGPGTPGVRAIELIDGSPRGLGQVRTERAAIIHLADSTNLALVAGSDSHGWGHAAVGWTLMFLPQWRAATPDLLAAGINRVLRGGGRASTRVVERYVAHTDAPALVAFTVPVVAWGMLRTLSGEERIVWIAWATILYVLWLVRRRRSLGAAPAA